MPDVQDIVAEVLRDDEYVLGTFGDTGPQGEKGDQGDTGPQGPAGPSNVLSIGTVVRGDDAEASITGTSPNQILNLTLPKGDTGEQGPEGPEGPAGFTPIANVTKSGDTITISITDKNGTTTESFTSYQEPLLSYKWSDHIINNISWLRADTFSWQSGDVYISVYNHLVNDYTNATAHTMYTGSNIYINGSITNNNGIISGFDANNYAYLPQSFRPSSYTWEQRWKVTTSSGITTAQYFSGEGSVDYQKPAIGVSNSHFVVWISSTGSGWDIASNVLGSYTVLVNTTYYVKFGWDGSEYYVEYSLDGTTYTRDITVTSSTAIVDNNTISCIGKSYTGNQWTGSIDLNYSSIVINNITIWQGVNTFTYYVAPDGHKLVTADRETDIMDMYNSTGVAWYYILDTENTQFKLPRQKIYQIDNLNNFAPDYSDETNISSGDTISETGWCVFNQEWQFNYTGYVAVNGVPVSGTYLVSATDTSVWSTRFIFPVSKGDVVTVDNGNRTYTLKFYPSKVFSSIQNSFKYLYFYVGNFSQSAIEQTAGLNSELFNGKADLNLNNIISADKVLNALAADMDSFTTIASITTFTAPSAGWINFAPGGNTCTSISLNTGSIGGYIQIEGKTVLTTTYAHGSDSGHADSGWFFIGKNQTCYHTMNSGVVYFYPCKGV